VGAEPYQLFCLRVPVTPQVGRGSVASTKQPSRTLLGNAVGDLLGAETQAAPVARPTGQ
jgi:hypothetical protein